MFYSNNFTLPEDSTLPVIDEILWLLKDGEWRNLREIIENFSLPKSVVKMAVNLLREYDFIESNGNGGKVRLHTLMLWFIDEIQRVEREEALKS